MNFIKLLFFTLFLSATLFAEGVPFTISSAELPPPEANKEGKEPAPTDLTLRLKYQAVINYLQEHLGTRYAKYADKVTPDFAEKYILEYKISRGAGEKGTVLSGSIDSDSLKRWLRKFEIKSQGASGLSPLFFISSEPPQLRAHESANAVKTGSPELFFAQLHGYFSKINSTLVPFQGSGLLTPTPPKTEAEIRQLGELGQSKGMNSAIWVHLSQCVPCGGSRADILFYYFPQNRLALGRADDLAFDFREPTSEKMKKMVKSTVEEFTGGMNELIEQGTLFSSVHTLVVDGLDSLRAFKQLDNGLSRLDFVTRVQLKKTESSRVEYEVLSGLSTEELMQRLQGNSFGGFKLRGTGTQGSAMQMKYNRGT